MRGHHAHADVQAVGTMHRHGPRKAVRRDGAAEVQLDVADGVRRQFPLGGVQIGARQPETEAALQQVRRAAGQHDEARGQFAAVDGGPHSRVGDVERLDARAQADLGPTRSLAREAAVSARRSPAWSVGGAPAVRAT